MIQYLLNSLLKRSEISSGAYDTAWLVRLHTQYPDYKIAIDWLRNRQHQDGSWGSDIYNAYDRVICTLSAFVALSELDDVADKESLSKATSFLMRTVHELDALMDTIGFPVLFAQLIEDANSYGLFIPKEVIPQKKIKAKLSSLSDDTQDWNLNSLYFSFEALASRLPQNAILELNQDGCIAASPSATISAMIHGMVDSVPALDYIDRLVAHQVDGGLPPVDLTDVYEITWILVNLFYCGLITLKEDVVKPALDLLYEMWLANGGGVGFSSRFYVPDLDETAVAYMLLREAGYDVSDEVFEAFEGPDYFYCFLHESDPSFSANIRFIAALEYSNHPKKALWQKKVKKAILNWSKHEYWFDKWHVSPYYLTASAIWMLDGILDEPLSDKIKWIMKTQNSDGGWGFYGDSTIEETAYCVQALAHWYLKCGVGYEALQRGCQFLETAPEYYPAMWVSKCLYTPHKVLESSILSAKHMAKLALQ